MTRPVPELDAGLSSAEVCELYDSLPGVSIDEILGQWHGSEVPTGHPLDGLLAVSGWYGKRFDSADEVHPLLFGAPGDLYPVNPGSVPINLLNALGTRIPRPKIPGIKRCSRRFGRGDTVRGSGWSNTAERSVRRWSTTSSR